MNIALLDFIVNGVLFWIAISLLVMQAITIVFHKDVSNIRTAPAIRDKIIEKLKEDCASKNKKSYTVVDLGCGNGSMTRAIARAMPEAKVIGIECAPHTYAIANFLKRRAKLNNLEYKRMDFFNYDLSDADAVTVYMIPSVMERLGKKLHAETKPGTLITCNKFHLRDGWEPVESLRVKTRYLHQGDLHIYKATPIAAP